MAGVLATMGGLAAAAVLAAAPAASADTVTLGSNSQANPFHLWVVPAGVCSATFDLYGAEGSGGVGGAHVTTTLPVTPGTTYYVFVGSWGLVGHGGYNGGGAASGTGVGGGGATDVRTGPSLTERILVAGGGGGNGGKGGGAGGAGGLVGANGADNEGGDTPGLGGGGGTALSGGAFGGGGSNGAPGTLGGGGQGGIGVPGIAGDGGDGGGGGGGLYGGGGGGGGRLAGGGGGGGGSSLAAGGTVTTTTGGQGKAIITYTTSPSCGQTGGGGGGGGGGGQTGGGTDKTKPRLRGLTLSRRAFVAARSGASIAPDTKSRPRTGTKVSFSLSETGKVRFTVERKVSGRRLRGRCVKPGRSPGGKRCTHWIAVKGSFSLPASAGKNTFIFRGRVGGRSLEPGDYRLNGKATDNAHNSSPVKRKGFEIVT